MAGNGIWKQNLKPNPEPSLTQLTFPGINVQELLQSKNSYM